jgi:hypothetical protein
VLDLSFSFLHRSNKRRINKSLNTKKKNSREIPILEVSHMTYSNRLFPVYIPRLLAITAAVALCSCSLIAQQTLGGITGQVTDPTGGAIQNATVTVLAEQTSMTRSTKTDATGVYTFVNLPIGSYTLTYSAEGFDAQKTQHIAVQAYRTATVNAALKVGQATTTVEVEATPLMNAVDTTNGYVMDPQQIDAAPLPTDIVAAAG